MNHYNNPPNNGQNLDPDIRDLDLRGQDIDAILSFLNTLNDNNFDRTIPNTVPSGLNPGGNL